MLVRRFEAKKAFNFVAQSFTLIGLMAYNLLFQARKISRTGVSARLATFTC
jgi:hypothetical protein